MNLIEVVFGLDRAVLTKGEVGIEIEEEGEELPREVPYWTVTGDGSLNESGREYVLTKPAARKDVHDRLSLLKKAHVDSGSFVEESIRTGVHVHINVQGLNIIQLHNFIVTYLILEEMLVAFCGPNREGNLFCLRARDAKALVWMVRNSVKDQQFRGYADEDFRYASINLSSLFKYGSLEFRAMRGTKDFDLIEFWVELLLKIKDYAVNIRDPRDIVESFSEGEFHNFAIKVLGEEHYREMGFTDNQVGAYLKIGVRNAQSIAFATNWQDIEEKERLNPFSGADMGIGREMPRHLVDIQEVEPAVNRPRRIDPNLWAGLGGLQAQEVELNREPMAQFGNAERDAPIPVARPMRQPRPRVPRRNVAAPPPIDPWFEIENNEMDDDDEDI